MTGFEPRTFGVRSDRSTNCATTTAQHILAHDKIQDKPYNEYVCK